MTENTGDTSGGVVDRRSRNRRHRKLHEIVAIVRPPDNPTQVKVFAADELDDAEEYARHYGAHVERLPG
jgi:hypothetical protein